LVLAIAALSIVRVRARESAPITRQLRKPLKCLIQLQTLLLILTTIKLRQPQPSSGSSTNRTRTATRRRAWHHHQVDPTTFLTSPCATSWPRLKTPNGAPCRSTPSLCERVMLLAH